MDISAILSEKEIIPCVEVDTKRQFFEQAAEILAEHENLDKAQVFEALWERENLGSTGYGEGIAIPHARIGGIDKVSALFVRLKKGIDFDSYDGKEVDMAAVLISPETSGEDHLKALAAFSRILKDKNICKNLRQAKTAHELYVLLKQ